MHITLLHNLRAARRLGTFLVTALVWMIAQPDAWAQGRTITGTVTAQEDKSPLPGVTVLVKGTTTGTATGADGTYSINVPGNETTLVFSFIGYTSQEVAVGTRSVIDVPLAADVQALNEVVVIGYGTQQKKDATGAVVALDAKEFNKGVISSPEQLLQGRAAGVQTTPASGEPGAGVNIRIRGTTSVRGGNNPLFVVDGVPLDGGNVSEGGQNFGAGSSTARNPLNFLNPNDIASISVLKDASAAAIYGARGANGVVLITTKRGKAGQQSLNFSANGSVSTPLKTYDLLDAGEFPAAVRAAGGNPDDPAVNAGGSTDWQDEIFRSAISQNYSLDFGGGNDNTNYFFSGSYSDQQGIVERSGLKRLTGRVNASHELFNDKVVLDLNLTTSSVRDQYVPLGDNAGFQGNLLGAALQANPTYPIRDAEGRWFNPGVPSGYETDGITPIGTFRNPVAMLQGIDDNGNTTRTLANISGTWRIIEGLSYKLNLGLDNSSSVRRTAIDRGLPGFQNENLQAGNPGFNTISVRGGASTIQNRFRNSLLLEHTLNYNKKIGTSTLDALAGFAYQKFENRGNFVQAGAFQNALINSGIEYYDNIGGVNNVGGSKAFFGGSDRSQNELQSYFGRVNYNLLDKYRLTATLRVDGSSRFGANNKYGAFPSFGGAWTISQESFMPQGIFDDLKLRATWGITGNQEFPGNISQPIYRFEANNGERGAVVQSNAENPDIRWESTTQWGFGLDYAFFNGRLSGSLDYFNKNTTDFIFNQIVAQPAPVSRRWVNLPGNIINKGFEFTLNYDVFQERKLGWTVSYNMTLLDNQVDGIGTVIPTGEVRGQGLSGAYAQTIRDGYPINAFFLRNFAGYDDQGLGVYPNGELLSFAGSPIANFNFGINNAFTYGPWNLSFFINGATGFYVYNNTANALFLKGNLQTGRNVSRDAANSEESSSNFGEASTRFLEKGDFARLSNLTLGYTFKLPEGGFAKSLNISLIGQNLILLTGYSGVDPEVNTNAARDDVPSLNLDYTTFPSARVFTFGVNVGF